MDLFITVEPATEIEIQGGPRTDRKKMELQPLSMVLQLGTCFFHPTHNWVFGPTLKEFLMPFLQPELQIWFLSTWIFSSSPKQGGPRNPGRNFRNKWPPPRWWPTPPILGGHPSRVTKDPPTFHRTKTNQNNPTLEARCGHATTDHGWGACERRWS